MAGDWTTWRAGRGEAASDSVQGEEVVKSSAACAPFREVRPVLAPIATLQRTFSQPRDRHLAHPLDPQAPG